MSRLFTVLFIADIKEVFKMFPDLGGGHRRRFVDRPSFEIYG
jgi:hypothetical protein